MTQNVLSFIVYALELCGIIQSFLNTTFVVYLSRLTLVGSYPGFGLVQLVLAAFLWWQLMGLSFQWWPQLSSWDIFQMVSGPLGGTQGRDLILESAQCFFHHRLSKGQSMLEAEKWNCPFIESTCRVRYACPYLLHQQLLSLCASMDFMDSHINFFLPSLPLSYEQKHQLPCT